MCIRDSRGGEGEAPSAGEELNLTQLGPAATIDLDTAGSGVAATADRQKGDPLPAVGEDDTEDMLVGRKETEKLWASVGAESKFDLDGEDAS